MLKSVFTKIRGFFGIGKMEIEQLHKSEDAETVEVAEDFAKSISELDESLSKAKKSSGKDAPNLFFDEDEKSDDDEGDEDEEDEDDEDEESDDDKKEDKAEAKAKSKKSMKKSVEDIIRADNAGEAIDVEPFLKSLVSAIDQRITAEFKTLNERFTAMDDVLTKSAKVSLQTGNLIKSMSSAVEKVGGSVEDRKSLLKSVKVTERMFKGTGEGAVVSYQEAQSALSAMAKSRKLSPTQIAIVEGRMSRGEELPQFFLDACATQN